MFMTTAGASNSLTMGSFTVSDTNSPSGGGCAGIVVSVPAGTLVANGGPGWTVWTAGGGTGETTSGQRLGSPGDATAGTLAVTSGTQNNLFSAVINDGSSMVTGIISDSTIENTSNGPRGCLDWGGLGGT